MNDRQVFAKLRRAINTEDYKAAERLVKGGVNVNEKLWYESTFLHDAVSMSNVNLVELLTKAGADVNHANQDGRTALHLACRGGHVGIVQILIAAGTLVNKCSQDGKTCLHVAAWRGHQEVVEMLVNAGAEVNIPDSQGCTALYWAVNSNHLCIVQILVTAGAKVNYKVKSKWTPFHTALRAGYMDIVRYLLLQGVETNITVDNKTVISLLMGDNKLTQEVRQNAVDMFVLAGYNLNKDSWMPSASSSANKYSHGPNRNIGDNAALSRHEIMADWLESRKKTLPTLTNLCRTRVRKRLSYCNKGRSIMNIIPRLPLPSILVDFISFTNDPLFQEKNL